VNGAAMRAAPRGCASGRASAMAQYGELFQGAVRDGHGRTRRCLVSLPCTALASTACFEPASHRPAPLVVSPRHKRKAAHAARLTLALLGHGDLGGTLTIESTILEGKGCGSSTADCMAAVRAVASQLETALSPAEIADLVVRAERAAGSVMFEDAVLFAHREGCVLDAFHKPIPRMTALGFDTDPAATVDTLRFEPARYSAAQLRTLEHLATGVRCAILTQDATLLGAIATSCAEINQEFLPTRHFLAIRAAARDVGALGLAVAHTGTVAAILLDARDTARDPKMTQLEQRLGALGAADFIRFDTAMEAAARCPLPVGDASVI
jgi:uncharacterized protein involved in propanediol utilization